MNVKFELFVSQKLRQQSGTESPLSLFRREVEYFIIALIREIVEPFQNITGKKYIYLVQMKKRQFWSLLSMATYLSNELKLKRDPREWNYCLFYFRLMWPHVVALNKIIWYSWTTPATNKGFIGHRPSRGGKQLWYFYFMIIFPAPVLRG